MHCPVPVNCVTHRLPWVVQARQSGQQFVLTMLTRWGRPTVSHPSRIRVRSQLPPAEAFGRDAGMHVSDTPPHEPLRRYCHPSAAAVTPAPLLSPQRRCCHAAAVTPTPLRPRCLKGASTCATINLCQAGRFLWRCHTLAMREQEAGWVRAQSACARPCPLPV